METDKDKTPEPSLAEVPVSAEPDVNSDLQGIDMTETAIKQFESIDKNIFMRGSGDSSKHEESIPCHCRYNSERDPRYKACGENSDCINRLVQMECNPLTCPCGSYCLNRRFQKRQYAKVRIVDAGRKGYGMQALEDLDTGSFVMEYIGEVVTSSEFRKRAAVYQSEGVQHHYFMSIGNNKIIDATRRGCIARFINHSCGPNCVLQKWMVGGAIRMGIFVERPIKRGEEITFDYKFERMSGSEPQPCYCGSPQCKGIIGVAKERVRKHAANVSGMAVEGDDDDDNVVADIDEEIEDDTVTKHQRDDIRRRHAAVDDEEYGYSADDMAGSGSDSEAEGTGASAGSSNDGTAFKRIRRRNTSKRKKRNGLTSPEQVLKFVQIMHRSSRQTRIIQILIGKLMETDDRRLLKSLIGLQGMGILRTWLQDYENDDVMLIKILQCIAHMPVSTRNSIEEGRLEEVIKPLCTYSDENVASLASDLIERWSTLRHVFKIPKKTRKESAATTPASETPAASRRQSPSHHAEGAPPLPNQTAGAAGAAAAGGVADSSARMRWRSSANLHTRMRSESPMANDAHAQQHSQPYHYGNHHQHSTEHPPSDVWSRRGNGPEYRGYSPPGASHQDYSRTNRSPARAPYNGFRARYNNQASRSRSPAYMGRSGSYSSLRNMRPSGYATPGGTSYNYGQPRNRYTNWNTQTYSAQASGAGYDNVSNPATNGDVDGAGNGGRPGYADKEARSDQKLAPGWKTAYTNDGVPYYYHETTKQTQWDPPLAEPAGRGASSADQVEVSDSFGSRGLKRRNLGLGNGHTNGSSDRQYHDRFSEMHRASSSTNQGGYHLSRGSRVPSTSSAPGTDERWSYARRSVKEYSANGSPAGATTGTATEDERAGNVIAKARVDDIVERAQRMGMLHSQTGNASKGLVDSVQKAASTSSSNQLVTPETDGEQVRKSSIPSQSHLATAATAAAAAAAASASVSALALGSSKVHNNDSESPKDVSSSLAKREKLEKKATAELAAFVVRAMSKYKSRMDHDQFKHEARKITKILMEKERKTPPFDPLKLIELSQHKKTKIKQFISDYVSRLTNRRPDTDSPRNTSSSAAAAASKTPPI
ncbi:hypothetical protein H4R99_005568 [Coemansia sp. RSA 1722]|nr:hypothetical protein H4R99_005568 [Coemansia sp. RSA 1722]KAJ2600307.1 hypothetical protein GGF39_001849 [Coemansia sp. RSA 1721]